MSNARGIDISVWQGTTPSLRGKAFAIARSSIGLQTDRYYAMHMANIKAAGVVSGAYHFNWDTIDPREQARYFIKAAGNVDLYAIDVEGANAFNLAQTKAFIDECHKLGKKCGLYHSASGYMEAGQDWDWIAKWSSNPPSHSWDFWQYGSDHDYNSTIDGDVFHGTEAQLRAWVKGDSAGDDTVDSFKVPKVPTIGDLAKGKVLYTSDALDANDPDRIILDPGRTVPVEAYPKTGVTGVQYVDEQGVKSGTVYFVHSADLTNVRPLVLDDGYTKATQDAAVAAQKKADQAAIDAANAAAAKAQADLATAAATERERIATTRGKAEADSIRNT